MGIIYGTGFEVGALPVAAADYSAAGVAISTTKKKTGSYSVSLLPTGGDAWIRFPLPGSPTDVYLSAWFYPASSGSGRIMASVVDDAAGVVEVRLLSDHWAAYVNGALVATGTHTLDDLEAWHLLQVRFKIHDTDGKIQVVMDGHLDIDYTGDTKIAGGAHWDYFRLLNNTPSTATIYLDDLTIATGGWPGDINYEAIVPDGAGSVTQWTPSAGANWDCVEEVPPSDANYVSAALDAKKDTYSLSAWTATAKRPVAVIVWLRAFLTAPGAEQVKHYLVAAGGDTSTGAAVSLDTTPLHYQNVVDLDPDTALPWQAGAIAGIEVGQESEV